MNFTFTLLRLLMLQKYKHLHKITFASCLLYKQWQVPALILIRNVRSVSCCSTVMVCAIFNFLSIVYFTKCASQYIMEKTLSGGRSRYKFSICVCRGLERAQNTTKYLDISVYNTEGIVCPVTFCNHKWFNITLSQSAVFYIIMCHESECIPESWLLCISLSCNIN